MVVVARGIERGKLPEVVYAVSEKTMREGGQIVLVSVNPIKETDNIGYSVISSFDNANSTYQALIEAAEMVKPVEQPLTPEPLCPTDIPETPTEEPTDAPTDPAGTDETDPVDGDPSALPN